MSKHAVAEPVKEKGSRTASRVFWFEIPTDNVERARKFYSALFGWKIEKFPGAKDYWHIDTGGGEDAIDGGMLTRKHQQQPITNYITVESVTASAAQVEELGGKVMKSKTAVPHMGYFAICRDSENNEFAIWEMDDNAK
jgi:predicted enzyme related to lactoylglutathione lyase